MNPLLEAIERTLSSSGDRLAVWSRDSVSSFAELDDLSRRVGAWLDELDAGRLVALGVGNRPGFPALVLGAWRSGRAVALLDAGSGLAARRRLAATLGAALLVCRAEEAPGAPALEGAAAVVGGPAAVALPEDVALVKVTSGSTGQPAGVCLTAEALVAGIEQIAGGMGIRPDDMVLTVVPMSHSYGFDSGVLSLAVIGTSLAIEASTFPTPILTAMAESGASVVPLVPPLVRALAEVDWPVEPRRLRLVISAGGPLDARFADAFYSRAGVAVSQFYGSTETGGIAFEHQPRAPGAVGTVGHPLPGVTVELAPTSGRVRVRSAANACGFIDGRGYRPAPAVHETGDTAAWNPDGRLVLSGRVAGLLNISGRKVQIAGLEQALRALPGVLDAAVVGVREAVRGDRAVAFVVTDGRRLRALDLPWGLPGRAVRYLDALPYTERGKLDRQELQALATASEGPTHRG